MSSLVLVLALAGPAHGATFRVAGNGLEKSGAIADGTVATATGLFALAGVTETPDGGFLLSSQGYIRKVDPLGRLQTLAGNGGNAGPPGDGGPAKQATVDPEGIASLPDGSYLIGQTGTVRLVGPDGIINRVAGTGRIGFGGDGGPATLAQVGFAQDVAPLPGGGFLIADASNHRIRQVGPDGTITTVAGSGPSDTPFGGGSFAGDGGPATSARLNTPQGVAALPGGGFVIADTENSRVRQVGADGVIRTIANLEKRKLPTLIQDVTVLADGAVAFTGGGKVRRIGPGGRLTELGQFVTSQLAATADGGVLVLGDDTVEYLAPRNPTRLGVAISGRTLAQTAKPRAIFDSTLAGTATVDLRLGKRRVSTVTRPVRAGSNTLSLSGKLKKGGLYNTTVSVTTASGAVTSASAPLLGPGLLPTGVARGLADLEADSNADAAYFQDVKSCKRRSARRVDCRIDETIADDPQGCTYILAVQLSTGGRLTFGTYRCPLGRRGRPRRRTPVPDELVTQLELDFRRSRKE